MYCNICWIEFNSQIVATSHYKSKQHSECSTFKADIENKQIKFPYYCETCCVWANTTEGLDAHLKSQKHFSKVKAKEILESSGKNHIEDDPYSIMEETVNLTDSFESVERKEFSLINKYYCKLCNVNTNSDIALERHLNGEKHKKKLQKINQVTEQNSNINLTEAEGQETLLQIDFTKPQKSLDNILVDYSKAEWCECCFVKYTSKSHRDSHLSGKDHLKKFHLKEITKPEPKHICKVCFIVFNTLDQLNSHYDNPNHKAQILKFTEYSKYNKQEENYVEISKKPRILDISLDQELDSHRPITPLSIDIKDTTENNEIIGSNSVLSVQNQRRFSVGKFKQSIFDAIGVEVLEYNIEKRKIMTESDSCDKDFMNHIDNIKNCLTIMFEALSNKF